MANDESVRITPFALREFRIRADLSELQRIGGAESFDFLLKRP